MGLAKDILIQRLVLLILFRPLYVGNVITKAYGRSELKDTKTKLHNDYNNRTDFEKEKLINCL